MRQPSQPPGAPLPHCRRGAGGAGEPLPQQPLPAARRRQRQPSKLAGLLCAAAVCHRASPDAALGGAWGPLVCRGRPARCSGGCRACRQPVKAVKGSVCKWSTGTRAGQWATARCRLVGAARSASRHDAPGGPLSLQRSSHILLQRRLVACAQRSLERTWLPPAFACCCRCANRNSLRATTTAMADELKVRGARIGRHQPPPRTTSAC